MTGGDAWAVAVLRTEGAWIEALRPRAWLAAEGVTPGALTWIEVEELGVRGDAEVVAVRDAPVVGQGQGCVVLTTMLTQSDAVVSVVLDDDTRLDATSGHPLRSADRDAWVAAGALKRGERVTTADGVRVVRAVAALGGARRVFNLEVETRHTYYAGEAAVLAHNNCGVGGAHGGSGGQLQIAPLSQRTMLESANSAIPGGGTEAGRALQKHASRAGSWLVGLAFGGNHQKNADAATGIINDVVARGQVSVVPHRAEGYLIRMRLPDGAGAAWRPDGSFFGFLERYTPR